MISKAIDDLWAIIYNLTPGTFWETILTPALGFLYGFLKDMGL